MCSACPTEGLLELNIPLKLMAVAMQLADKIEQGVEEGDETVAEQFAPHIAAVLDTCQAVADTHAATAGIWMDSPNKELLRMCMAESREVVHPAFCLLRSLVRVEEHFMAAVPKLNLAGGDDVGPVHQTTTPPAFFTCGPKRWGCHIPPVTGCPRYTHLR